MTTTTTSDSYYTVKDLCGILRLGDDTVRRLLRDREIPSLRVGVQYRVARSNLAACLAGNTFHADAAGGTGDR